MKRRQRRQVLDINGEDSNSPRRRWQNKYQQINVNHPEDNEPPSNPLANLLGQYNSDSESEDPKQGLNKLDDQVNHFLKEIQLIAPEKPPENTEDVSKRNSSRCNQSNSLWQECFDESSGYPYYWHTETNEVTWEIPEELKNLHQNSEKDAAQISHPSRWPNYSPNLCKNSYQQSENNIPEGMIPREVVARNRNRQVGLQHKHKQKETSPVQTARSSGFREDDSDDGKIEMITSFGNDGSDSDTSDNESPQKKSTKSKAQTKSNVSQDVTDNVKNNVEIGPSLPHKIVPMVHGPEFLSNEETKEENSTHSSTNMHSLKESEEEKPTSIREKTKSEESLKISLVPGYADDSDNEEDTSSMTSPKKPLFPIADYEEIVKVRLENSTNENSTTASANGIVKKVETKQIESGSIRIFEYHSTEKSEKDESSNSQKPVSESSESSQVEELRVVRMESKPNIFLENLETPAKGFQRKKRIAFDVIRNQNVSKETQNKSSETSNVPNSSSIEEEAASEKDVEAKDEEKKDEKVKGPEEETNENSVTEQVDSKSLEESEDAKNKEKQVEEQKNSEELKEMTGLITEKLKFLSEGSPPTSAVQVMAIQLHTLMAAWDSGDLKGLYLRKWLTGTNKELSQLERAAAPPGWDCQWDRSHKRYYYRNVTSGEAQWTYPSVDIIGGTEEMELCTTPPPPDQEESPIIESRPRESSDKQDPNNKCEDAGKEMDKEANAPPPPHISSPSPPPPPKIYAEDLKKGKKRRGSCNERTDSNKKEKQDKGETVNPPLPPSPVKTERPPLPPNPSNNEPLPPGIDPSDLAYITPISSIERGVLYTNNSHANPIYAATLADPSLLSHQTALLQGQLMHYPTYHQHLHNQALLAAANRLAGQDTVQFMVTDYGQMYSSSQVIAKPPVKATPKESMGSVLNSFYNDLATIENTKVHEINEESISSSSIINESVPSPIPPAPSSSTPEMESQSFDSKEKKKKSKVAVGKKHKEMSSMVAKWQKVQQNFEDHT